MILRFSKRPSCLNCLKNILETDNIMKMLCLSCDVGVGCGSGGAFWFYFHHTHFCGNRTQNILCSIDWKAKPHTLHRCSPLGNRISTGFMKIDICVGWSRANKINQDGIDRKVRSRIQCLLLYYVRMVHNTSVCLLSSITKGKSTM